jgi:hypothetical protein
MVVAEEQNELERVVEADALEVSRCGERDRGVAGVERMTKTAVERDSQSGCWRRIPCEGH